MTYKVPLPFIKYVCCTCEWVLHGNLCKHQVAIFFTFIDFIKKNIIQYYGTWYGSDYGGFATMFWTLPICTFMTMNIMMKRPMKIIMKTMGC